MKGFALDDNGDVIISNNEIQLVYGTELTEQTIRSVLLTKKNEWFLDWEEGVDYNLIFGKHEVNEDVLRSVIRDGLAQVDEYLSIEELHYSLDKATRKLHVDLKIINEQTNETTVIEDVWG